jgi:hypothetical protein
MVELQPRRSLVADHRGLTSDPDLAAGQGRELVDHPKSHRMTTSKFFSRANSAASIAFLFQSNHRCPPNCTKHLSKSRLLGLIRRHHSGVVRITWEVWIVD